MNDRFVQSGLLRAIPLAAGVVLAAVPAAGAVECDFTHGPCVGRVGAARVALDITPKPVTAMEELSFRLRLEGADLPSRVRMSLQMPGMNMGRNEIVLVRGTDGTWSGKGVLPRCGSGRKRWTATLAVPGASGVSFAFDVR